jgi:hypothetical protein
MRFSVSRRRSLYLEMPGRLLQVDAQLLRASLDQARDHALFDDRVAAWPQAGAEEDVGDVALARRFRPFK